MNPDGVVFRRVEVNGGVVDVRCAGEVITDVARPGSVLDAGVVVEGGGAALIPGLHDHHIHLFALAAARASLDLSRVPDPRSFDQALRERAAHDPRGWVRVVGFHEAVHGKLDRHRLDGVARGRPVRVQHRTGSMWVINSPGLRVAGVDELEHPGVERGSNGAPTGRLFGVDDLLRERLDPIMPDVGATARELAGYGVTGVTDLTPTDDGTTLDALAQIALAPDFPLRVVVTGGPAVPSSAGAGLPRGPVKLVIGDHRLPALDELINGFRRTRAVGRTVAVHSVSRVALVLALAAWDTVGPIPGDRLEHGAVIPLDQLVRVHELGLVVVTQPSFVAERGDHYLATVDPDDLPGLWRCRSLFEAGIGVAGSTDAPFGPANPWHAMAAAVKRHAPSGAIVGPSERIEPERALAMFLTPPDHPAGAPRRIAVGAPADVCLLDRPLAKALDDPADTTVVATLG